MHFFQSNQLVATAPLLSYTHHMKMFFPISKKVRNQMAINPYLLIIETPNDYFSNHYINVTKLMHTFKKQLDLIIHLKQSFFKSFHVFL